MYLDVCPLFVHGSISNPEPEEDSGVVRRLALVPVGQHSVVQEAVFVFISRDSDSSFQSLTELGGSLVCFSLREKNKSKPEKINKCSKPSWEILLFQEY